MNLKLILIWSLTWILPLSAFPALSDPNADGVMDHLEKGVLVKKNTSEQTATEKENFDKFLTLEWRYILDHTEDLPVINGSQFTALNYIDEVSESLDPLNYIELVEKYVELVEAGKIPLAFLEARLLSMYRKREFFVVNYEHPRVRKILTDSTVLFAHDPNMIASIQHILSGANADEYLYGASDGELFPETLPGIKLKQPFRKIRDQVERLTGTKISDDEYDARWREYDKQWKIRNERRQPGVESLRALVAPERYEPRGPIFWCILGAVVFAMGFGILRLRKRKLRRL